ncbi:hypothetical protein [Catellatospora sp. NPDC049609]|uniref:hypothetical protein n=1 Tax=Catellatospora sp. NPDC049609 TaxID=3155505 RepID=UPI003415F947
MPSPSPTDAPRLECTCPEHVEELHDLIVPSAEPHHLPHMSVRELRGTGDFSVQALPERDRRLAVFGDDGESYHVEVYQWSLWAGDAARCFYDDDAELALDDSLRERAGIERVAWLDREVFHLAAPGMCAGGVLAAAARALLDARVRRTG